MTKSEFLEIENKDGFNIAVYTLAHEIRGVYVDGEGVFKELCSERDLIEKAKYFVDAGDYYNALQLLNFFAFHKFYGGSGYFVYKLATEPKYITQISDIEDFLEKGEN